MLPMLACLAICLVSRVSGVGCRVSVYVFVWVRPGISMTRSQPKANYDWLNDRAQKKHTHQPYKHRYQLNSKSFEIRKLVVNYFN